jgi:hypothetical protein
MTDLTRRGRLGLAVVVLALTVAGEGQAGPDLTVYATESSNGGSNSTFGTLDLTTGQFSALGNMSVTVLGLTTGANGTLYATDANGSFYTVGGNGSTTQFGTNSGVEYFGLAYAGSSGFYGVNIFTGNLDQISPTATSFTAIGALPTIAGSGSLAYGPGGSLYFAGFDGSGNAALFGINTTTGVATEIGTGLVTFDNDPLTLVYTGGLLYGIDTGESAGAGPINIYTISTTTGAATATGVTVSGLSSGFTLDTAAAIPEPSSLALCAIAGVIGLAAARVHRKYLAA